MCHVPVRLIIPFVGVLRPCSFKYTFCRCATPLSFNYTFCRCATPLFFSQAVEVLYGEAYYIVRLVAHHFLGEHHQKIEEAFREKRVAVWVIIVYIYITLKTIYIYNTQIEVTKSQHQCVHQWVNHQI